jgi:hypothetical protein
MTDEEIQRTAELLKKLKPGLMPYPIFKQVARIAALPVVEIVPLIRSESGVEVLLIDRGPNDPLWPNMLHTPGTIIRADDINTGERHNWQAFERIMHDELKDTEVGTPYYVGSMLHQSKRGAEQAQLYWVEVTGVNKVGDYYPVSSLPESLINSQTTFIKLAGTSFAEHKRLVQVRS